MSAQLHFRLDGCADTPAKKGLIHCKERADTRAKKGLTHLQIKDSMVYSEYLTMPWRIN